MRSGGRLWWRALAVLAALIGIGTLSGGTGRGGPAAAARARPDGRIVGP